MNAVKKIIKFIITNIPVLLIELYDAALPVFGFYRKFEFRDKLIDFIYRNKEKVRHNGCELIFVCPGTQSAFRAKTFSNKEPETLAWIDTFEETSVFWDIGANVGLYSIYAAKRHDDIEVYSFEPSVFNLELLCRNISENGLSEKITVVPAALSSDTGIQNLSFENTQIGGALAAFGVAFGHDGKPIEKSFEYKTIGFSMQDFVNIFSLKPPNYLKIDVDGIEHLIIRGGIDILRQENVKSVLVEVNEDFSEQRDYVLRTMNECNFPTVDEMREKHIVVAERFRNTYNVIFSR